MILMNCNKKNNQHFYFKPYTKLDTKGYNNALRYDWLGFWLICK